jgi:hypothetical protein
MAPEGSKPAPSASVGTYELDYSAPAIAGSTTLTSGFDPDPFSVEVTAGGAVNVDYLGADCLGYPTSEPSFSVTYSAGSATLLRFYVSAPGDTTLIVNTPDTSFLCGDESFGTSNPAIDFENPSSGRYDVWVAPFQWDQSLDATLYVTEDSDNHP